MIATILLIATLFLLIEASLWISGKEAEGEEKFWEKLLDQREFSKRIEEK